MQCAWVPCAWVLGCSGLRSGLGKRWARGHQGLFGAGVPRRCELTRGGKNSAPILVHLWLKKKYDLADIGAGQTVCQPNSTRPDSTGLDSTRPSPRLDPSFLGQVHLRAQVPPCLPKTCQVFQDARVPGKVRARGQGSRGGSVWA